MGTIEIADSNILLVPTVSVLFGILGYFVIISSLSSRKKNDAKLWPMAPGKLPLIGHMHHFSSLLDFPNVLAKWADTQSAEHGCYDVELLGKTITIVCREDRLREILKHRPKDIHRGAIVREAARSVGGTGLFHAEGEQWKLERRLVSPTLNKLNVQEYLKEMKFYAGKLVGKWAEDIPDERTFKLSSSISRAVADSLSKVALGQDFDFLSNPESQIAKDLYGVLGGAFYRALSPIEYWRMPIVGNYLDLLGFGSDRLRNLFDGLITEQELLEENKRSDGDGGNNGNINSPKTKNFLQKLFQTMKVDNSKLERSRMVGNIVTLFLAGTDTSTKTLVQALYFLAKDEALQEELRKEVAGIDLEPLSLNDLFEVCPMVKSFFHEVTRHYGAPFLILETQREIPFCGHTLPKGREIVLLSRYMSVSALSPTNSAPGGPLNSPPDQFCAKRYLVSRTDDEANNKTTSEWSCPTPPTGASFGGFGFGQRVCPGRLYAEAMALCVLISTLQRFELELPPDHEEPYYIFDVTYAPQEEVELTFKKLTST